MRGQKMKTKKSRKQYQYKDFTNSDISREIFKALKIFKRKKQVGNWFSMDIFNLDTEEKIINSVNKLNVSKFLKNVNQVHAENFNSDQPILNDSSQVFIHLDHLLNTLIMYSFTKNLHRELKSSNCPLNETVKRNLWRSYFERFLSQYNYSFYSDYKRSINLSFSMMYFNNFQSSWAYSYFSDFIIERSQINRVLKSVYLDTVQAVQDCLEHIELYTPEKNKINQDFISGLFYRMNDTFSFYKGLNKIEMLEMFQKNSIPAFSCEPLSSDSELFISKRFAQINNREAQKFIVIPKVPNGINIYAVNLSAKETFILNIDNDIRVKFPSVELTSGNNRLRNYNFRVHEKLPYAQMPYEKNRKDNIYLGVELECNKTARCPQNIYKSLEENILAGTSIVKHDGSLGSRGLEINIVPMTLDYAKSTDYYFNLENKTKDYLKSYSDQSTGLHVHVGRSLFTKYQIGLIGQFINKPSNYNFIVDICGRELNGTDNSYAETFSQRNTDKKLCYHFAKHDVGKYTAFNTVNDETLEFRIFKGNMSAKTIYRYLEFVHCLVVAVKSYSLNHNTSLSQFKEFVNENKGQYPILHEFIFSGSAKKIESWNMSFNKRFNGIEFNVPKLKLAQPVRVQRVKAINPRRRAVQQDTLFNSDQS